MACMTNATHSKAHSVLNSLPKPSQLASLPLQFLDGVQRLLGRNPPPAWLMAEAINKVLLLVNHVLDQEPQATARLARHHGKRIAFSWTGVHVLWVISPAGLLMTVDTPDGQEADLRIDMKDAAFSSVAQSVLQGAQPDFSIHGDVMLAAELGWLREHVRWDVEDDLARIVGDTPAVWLVSVARQVATVAKSFVARHNNAGEAQTS
jgi:ubiquinone biosynthesis accessory factor UbiJ